MRLTSDELEAKLAAIERRVRGMLANRDAFPRAFEDESELLLDQLEPAKHVYALDRLHEIVERSGFNRPR